MKSNTFKKFVTPILVTLLCLAVLFSGLYCSIAIAKTSPPINGDGSTNQPDVPLKGNTMADQLPSDHYVKAVDESYQYETGSVKPGYKNDDLTNAFEIRTKSDLQSWLVTPNNGDRDAKLMNDIQFNWNYSAIDHGTSVDNNNDGLLLLDDARTRYKIAGINHANSNDNVPRKARINGGRVLEGMGFTITHTQYHYDGLTHATGYFAYEIFGTLQNIKFVTTADLVLNNHSGGWTYHTGFLAHELMSGGTISNVKVTLGAKMGADTGGGSGSWCNVYVGGFVGKSAGTIKDSEMALGDNGAFYAYSGYDDSWPDATVSYTWLGGFVGEATSPSAVLLRCTLNLNNRGANGIQPFQSNQSDRFDKTGGGAYGKQNGGRVEGIIVKNHNTSVHKFNNFIGTPGDGQLKGLYLQNNDNVGSEAKEKVLPYVRTSTASGIDLNWDKTALDSNDITGSRILVKRYGMAADNIYWSLQQMDNGSLLTASSPDLFRYDINMSDRISVPAFTPSVAKEEGDTFSILEGRVGKIKDILFRGIVDNITTYSGKTNIASLTLSSSDGRETWLNDNKAIIRYSGKTIAPSLPGIHIATVRATTPPSGQENSFAYFDAEGRKLIWANDDLTREKATLEILKGSANITAMNMDHNPSIGYIDDTWTSKAIVVNLQLVNQSGMTADSRPDTIKLTTATKEYQLANPFDNSIWIEEKAYGVGNYNLSKVHQGVPYRFAFFKGAMQLTTITDSGVLPKVDEVDPTIRLNPSHDDPRAVKYLGNWMDRYSANKNDTAECAQLWVNSTFGASELRVQVRKKKVGATEFDKWGDLEYIPHDGSLYYNSIFAQRLYDEYNTREQNQAKYGGEWVIQVRAKSGANKWAEVTTSEHSSKLVGDENEQILQTQVKVDYTDYKIDQRDLTRYWNGSSTNPDDLKILPEESSILTVNYATDRKFFYRNEAMSYTIKTAEAVDDMGYSLVSVNGNSVPTANKKNYTGSYFMSNSDAIGVSPILKANLKKVVYGKIANISNNTYGDVIPNFNTYLELSKVDIAGLEYDFVTTPSLTNSKGESVSNISNRRMPKGTYTVKITAELSNDEHKKMYEAEVSSNTFTIVPKNIALEFITSTLSCSYRNFTPTWVKVANFDSQIVEGDTLLVTSIAPDIMPPASEIELGPVKITCKVKLSNDNYTCDSIAEVTLAKFLTDSEDSSVYLIESAEDFVDIKDGFLSANFKQVNNIDFGAKAVKPLNEFSGIYNGNGYTISNFKLITKASKNSALPYNIGLFSSLKNSTVKNIIIRDIVIEYTGADTATANVGIVAGKLDNSTIDNVMVHGSITVNGIVNPTTPLNVGVMVGSANNVTIKDSMAVANINVISSQLDTQQTNANVGGFVGSVTGNSNAILYSNIIAQGMLNVKGSAGQFVGSGVDLITLTSVTHMQDALTHNGEVMANVEGSSAKYATFAADKTLYAEITDGLSTSRGATFGDILKRLVPSSMIVNGNIAVLKVSNFRELLRLNSISWANFEITSDIYCFIGFDYNANQRIIGNVINNGGYKIYSDNGVYDIGSPSLKE